MATFNPQCGENVVVMSDCTTASWKFAYTGGVAFMSSPLTKETSLELLLAETGHVQMGIIYKNPDEIESVRAACERDVIIVNDVRVHRRECHIKLRVREDQVGRYEVVFEHGNAVQRKTLDLSQNIWLVIQLKFGSITATIGMFYTIM